MENTSLEEESSGKDTRTIVKDKSAKLEAKLEREIKKKMVNIERNNHLFKVLMQI